MRTFKKKFISEQQIDLVVVVVYQECKGCTRVLLVEHLTSVVPSKS